MTFSIENTKEALDNIQVDTPVTVHIDPARFYALVAVAATFLTTYDQYALAAFDANAPIIC